MGKTGTARRLRSAVVLALAVALGCFALATCGGDTRLTLRLSTWSSPTEMEIMERCIRLFEQRYPNVRVIHESYPSRYLDRILTSIAAGTPPDVILLDSVHIPTFIESGALIDLAPYAERVGFDRSLYYPVVLATAERDGKLYAFPKDFTPLVYFYNRRLFDVTGTPYPEPDWTWDDFLRTCQQLTSDDDGDGRPDRFGTDLNRELFRWQPWLWSAGGDILSPDGTRAVGYFDSEESVRTYEFLADLVRRWCVTPRYEANITMSRDYNQAQRMFYSGRLGLMASGHWWIPRLRHYMEEELLSVGIAPMPRFDPGSRPVTVMYESGWAVPAASRHRKWAVILAAFMSGEECQWIRCEAGLAIPAMPGVAAELAAADTTGMESIFLDQIPHCRAPWGTRIAHFTEVEDIVSEVFDRMLINGEPAAEAASAVAKEIEDALRSPE